MDFASHLRRYLGVEMTFSINDTNTLFTLDFSWPHLMPGTTVIIQEVNDDCVVLIHPDTQKRETIHFSRLNIVEAK